MHHQSAHHVADSGPRGEAGEERGVVMGSTVTTPLRFCVIYSLEVNGWPKDVIYTNCTLAILA